MRFELAIAWRFLTEGRAQTLLIIVGIAVGIGVQVFLDSLITGLQLNLIDTTVGTSAHVTATSADRTARPILDASSMPTGYTAVSGEQLDRPIRGWEPVLDAIRIRSDVRCAIPTADGPAFVTAGEKPRPVTVRGLSFPEGDSLYRITPRMTEGAARVEGNAVLVGTGLAEILRLHAGSALRLSLSGGRTETFTVAGIFDFDNLALNETWVIMNIRRAQSLFELDGGISSIEFQVKDVFGARAIAAQCASSYPELKWISWQQSNAALLAGLNAQSGSSYMIQALVILAVTLGIASVLAVSAVQKTKQLGILKALGTPDRVVIRIFLLQGALLGFAGAVVGCGFGVLLIQGFLLGTAAGTGTPLFPLVLSESTFITALCVATVAGTLAAAAPARASAQLNPIEVIRNG